MTQRAQDLVREALALPVDERADVAAQLLASLDDEDVATEDIEAAWAVEIENRARRVLSGQSEGLPWEATTRRGRTAQAVTKPVRFEDEADAEYRAGGRWYEERVVGLGMEFFDAVDAVLDQISDWHYFPLPGPILAEPDCRSPTGGARSSPCARWPPVVFPPNSLPAGSGASGWTSLLERHDVFRGPISGRPMFPIAREPSGLEVLCRSRSGRAGLRDVAEGQRCLEYLDTCKEHPWAAAQLIVVE